MSTSYDPRLERATAAKAGVWAQGIFVRRGKRGMRVWFCGSGGLVLLEQHFRSEQAALQAAIRWARENALLVQEASKNEPADLPSALTAAGMLG